MAGGDIFIRCDFFLHHYFCFWRGNRGNRYIGTTKDIVKSVFASSMIENLADRAIAFAIAYVLLKRIPKRFLSQYAVDSADEDEDDD